MMKKTPYKSAKKACAERSRYAMASVVKGYVLIGIVESQENMLCKNRVVNMQADGSRSKIVTSQDEEDTVSARRLSWSTE